MFISKIRILIKQIILQRKNTAKNIIKLLRLSKKNVEGRYNPVNLLITIHSKGEPFSLKDKVTVIHELTHYIQNVATVYGATHMLDLFEFMLNTFSQLGSSPVDPAIPLQNDQHLKKLGYVDKINSILASDSDGFNYAKNGDYLFKNTDKPKFTVYEEHSFFWIAYNGKRVPLNALLFQENMAFVNTTLATLSGQRYSNERVEGALLANETEQSYVYIVILDFVNFYFPTKNILKLSFFICETILNFVPVEKEYNNTSSFANVILSYLRNNSEELNGMSEEKIINYTMNKTGLASLAYSEIDEWNKREKNLEQRMRRQNNSFTQMMLKFMDCIKRGLTYREKVFSLYSNEFTRKYLKPLIQDIGAPLIFFDEVPKVYSMDEYVPQEFKEVFVFIYSSLEVFFRVYKDGMNECPFFRMNVCAHKKNDNCEKDSLANWSPQQVWICQLTDCLLCTGIRSTKRT